MKVSCIGPNGREIEVYIHEDGSVAVTGSTNVKAVVPYVMREAGPEFFPTEGEATGSLIASLRVPGSLGAMQVIFHDTSHLVLGNKPYSLTLEEEKGRWFVVARDGTYQWTKEHELN
jgi:hypothetical protein